MIQNSEKTIYLHIGIDKTGTTSIQTFLFRNREVLEKHGVTYPVFDPRKASGSCTEMNALILRSLYTLEENECRLELEKLIGKINSSTSTKIVLSEEQLCTNMAISRLIIDVLVEAGYHIKIIIYVRPAVTWLASRWYQMMKPFNGYTQGLGTCCEILNPHTLRLLEIVEKFGKDNVTIRPYEKCQWKNNNLIEDFLDVLDVPLTNEFTIGREQNTSKGRNTAELMRMVALLGVNRKNFSVARLENACTHDIKVIETLTDAEILAVTEKHAPDFKKLANIYGKESFFVNELPSCYGKERPVYDAVSLNLEQHAILIEALELNKREKDTLRKEKNVLRKEKDALKKELESKKTRGALTVAELYSTKSLLKFAYWRFRILSKITFGDARKRYKMKKCKARNMLKAMLN